MGKLNNLIPRENKIMKPEEAAKLVELIEKEDIILAEAQQLLKKEVVADQKKATSLGKFLKDMREELLKQYNDNKSTEAEKIEVNEKIKLIEQGIEELNYSKKNMIMTYVKPEVRQEYINKIKYQK